MSFLKIPLEYKSEFSMASVQSRLRLGTADYSQDSLNLVFWDYAPGKNSSEFSVVSRRMAFLNVLTIESGMGSKYEYVCLLTL